ncbi:hypothetical protein [Virgibacillus salexigens]|uniref:hypothetical protein n=1 Tax=Virgibacillus salexigens TaxID=61016 RepID=UPI00190AF18A|nr:hypothetical protein [Virgibacillus salexigens]
MENSQLMLRGLIEVYENDFMHGYEGERKEELRLVFLELIVAVTRYANNYRYCSNPECLCSPESHIRNMISRNRSDIYNELLGGYLGLSEVPVFKIRDFLKGFEGELASEQ